MFDCESQCFCLVCRHSPTPSVSSFQSWAFKKAKTSHASHGLWRPALLSLSWATKRAKGHKKSRKIPLFLDVPGEKNISFTEFRSYTYYSLPAGPTLEPELKYQHILCSNPCCEVSDQSEKHKSSCLSTAKPCVGYHWMWLWVKLSGMSPMNPIESFLYLVLARPKNVPNDLKTLRNRFRLGTGNIMDHSFGIDRKPLPTHSAMEVCFSSPALFRKVWSLAWNVWDLLSEALIYQNENHGCVSLPNKSMECHPVEIHTN